MSTTYIISDYGRLIKRGQVLQLKKGEDTLNTIFPFKTEQLVIQGKIEITSSAMNFLMKHKIETIFLSRNGKFNGKIDFQTGKNIFLRKRQYELLDNKEFSLNISKAIVVGKLKNQLTFMQRITRKTENSNFLKKSINEMKINIEKAKKTDNIDSLRGYEGNGARIYFYLFPKAIKQDWAKFNGRTMHPPKDNVNAVLSFIYTLILFRVDTAIETTQLDSYAGFLHTLDYGKKSLAFDLMEEYRTPIADTLTVAMFNLGILNEEDFEEVVISEKTEEIWNEEIEENNEITTTKTGCYLTKTGLSKVITQFERKLEDGIFYQPKMQKITYKKLFFEQVKQFKRVITGEQKEYHPLEIK